ncbi:uncharacterized protein EV422DRAFT_155950 [Fimicolochytrium jonesii]|uniref:uncharacterized protein n=1 Tax=Fimicolochytrium jonesii TaxID=1396493 RepID=UPI0022FEA162|nr:uncharacterized protein EV422DRAFT_155950 [Fimicolochytrium jonesii]KAI8826159.1 hypothetical protein EV422DRAFT_155950 [Fimicolochytrium jonesii]
MYLPESLPLRNDKATATSRWVGVPLRFAQLSYGALNAWISYKVGVYDLPGIAKAPVLDFTKANKQVLDILTDHNSAILVVEDMERKKYDSKFSTVTRLKNGQYSVLNTQFRNKLMFDDKVVMYLACGEEVTGTVVKGPHGKAKTVMPHKPIQPSENVKRITVVEQGAHRAADECLKDLFPKLVLFGDLSVSDIPFFSMLFLGDTSFKPHVAPSIKSKEHLNFYALACQTNTATRNVAVTLMKRGVEDFKIIVSDNFFVKWHEDQYKSIQDHVIESSIVKKDILDKLIGPHTVVLCSLAQLSNEKLIEVLQQRKLTHIVIDEASQISMADLPHILATYKASLQRLTFVGDPKQLAPFGSENHPSVQSVFERLPADVMLDEQYRMPHDLGSFISAYVYDGVLTSHKQPRNECSVALIDVANGKEQMLGTGFMVSAPVAQPVRTIISSANLASFPLESKRSRNSRQTHPLPLPHHRLPYHNPLRRPKRTHRKPFPRPHHPPPRRPQNRRRTHPRRRARAYRRHCAGTRSGYHRLQRGAHGADGVCCQSATDECGAYPCKGQADCCCEGFVFSGWSGAA